ncbi:MAG: SurA N-terminal domain-containing protein [Xanthomonadales bacterium]|nr:SurA N-terminal domain-containing protein [Xanthomonadales bacterium]
MLQTLREKTTGWVAVVIVGALAIPFAFVGIENYRAQSIADYVAKVGEIEISRDDFTRRFEGYVQRAQQMMGESFQRSLVDTPEARRQVLDQMIDEALYRTAAMQMGLRVTPERLQDEIKAIPALQVAGQFSPELYRDLLTRERLTASGLEQILAREIEASFLPEGLTRSALVTPAYVDSYLALRDQKRSFAYLELPAPALAETPDDAALRAHYDANLESYRSEETVSVEYIALDAASITVSEEVSDENLRVLYDEAGRRFVEPEQRLASHILIRVPANADAATEAEALSKAEAALARARAEGADFAALATELSEDPGSRGSGGDLGWLERGFTDPAFEEALFALSAGTLSEPVKSAEGWHVIQLREVRAEVAKPFEEVREELRAEYVAAEKERQLDELAGRMVELLLKDPTALEDTAAALGVELKTAGPFTRGAGVDAISNEAKVREAAFSPTVLEDRLVSDMIELPGGQRVALRVTDHVPSAVLAFEDVRTRVLAEVSEARLAEQARTEADALLAQLKSGEATLEAIAEARSIELKTGDALGRNAFTVNPSLLQQVFQMPAPSADAATWGQFDIGGASHAVVKLTSVQAGDPAAVPQAERDALREQVSQALGDAEARALAAALRQRTTIELAEDRL